MKPLAAVPPTQPDDELTPIVPTPAFFAWAVMRIAELQAENAKLLRAVQRESHHIDVRAGSDGRSAVIGRRS